VPDQALETLLAVTLVAAVAPLIAAGLPGKRVPQVVILIFLGILIGPHGLGLADTHGIRLLSDIGLGFLFLLAGYELDPHLLRERPGRLAMAGWAFSAALAVGAVALLASFHFIRDFAPIGLALTTTALGTLLPILHDTKMLGGRFGRNVLAAGAVGELFPIIAISLFLTRRQQYIAVASLVAVGVAALVLTTLPRIVGDTRLRALIRQGRRATAQTTLRWAIVLLMALLVAAEKFGLDVVLFVSSGMTLDVQAIIRSPGRVVVFLALLLVVRGLPSLLIYRGVLPLTQRVEMIFITATTMPLLIALAEIGLRDGIMLPANAAALVGAGVLSVLIFPSAAAALHKRARPDPPAGRPGAAELTGPAGSTRPRNL
jgi:Kef-type K+ transport system membrane component KefB